MTYSRYIKSIRNHKAPQALLLGSVLVIISLGLIYMWPLHARGHNDQYFYSLAATTQKYYQEQGAILGLDASRQPSKTCERASVGGPSKSTVLQCSIDFGGQIDPNKIAAANNLIASLKPILLKQGFIIRDPQQLNRPGGTVLMWATIEGHTIGNLCSATLDLVENLDGYGHNSLNYSLSCGDTALDTPQGFSDLP